MRLPTSHCNCDDDKDIAAELLKVFYGRRYHRVEEMSDNEVLKLAIIGKDCEKEPCRAHVPSAGDQELRIESDNVSFGLEFLGLPVSFKERSTTHVPSAEEE